MTPAWVAAAAKMPVAFAQVREDPLVDLAVLDLIGRADLSGIMIASGGCTAAKLVSANRFADLNLVDINSAQLALTRLKLHLLTNETTERRLEICGHLPMAKRRAELASAFEFLGVDRDVLGPIEIVSSLGPDHAGRYELVFAELRAEMAAFAEQWPAVLNGGDVAAVAPDAPLGRAMDRAFDQSMTLEHLVALFSAQATQNKVDSFSRHFARRTRVAIETLPTADNPFLWQLLTGRFPDAGPYDWFTAPPPERMPEVLFTRSSFTAALSKFQDRFDFVHLSNILDWLSPEEARETLRLAWQALRPGAMAVIRQLNSSLDLPALAPEFEWLKQETDALHASDRSFFYRRLHIGRKI
jgi:S-adenosylmethionine-diacylglycerol 3-amino-3-carboxypropyl transferase